MTPAEPRPTWSRRTLLRQGVLAAGALAAGPSLLRALGADGVADLGRAVRTAAVERVPPPPILTRADWGADESIRRGQRSFASIRKLITHHTDTANDERDPRARIRAIYAYHVQGRGWDDIGYNFVIDHEGRVYEGRWARDYAPGEVHDGEDTLGQGVVGAHAAGFNTGSCGVALLGTFTGSTATAAAVDSLVQLLAWKASEHGIDPLGSGEHNGRVYANIAGHRDVGSTACPGTRFYERLPEIRQRVRAEMSATGVIGYRILASDGSIRSFGEAPDVGDLPRSGVHGAPVRGMASTPSGSGAWVVGPDGGIFAFGDARFYGSMGGTPLNRPMVGMAPTGPSMARQGPDAAAPGGYWTVASDGGIFSFGDARFHGSTGSLVLNRPIVGMAPTPSGNGYWLVATDGGIFSFGDAGFHGSTGSLPLVEPIVGMAATPSGRGYWLVAADGGVFTFGDAPFLGAVTPAHRPARPVRSLRCTPTGLGYWILDSAGAVFTFGDAQFFGAGVGSGRTALDLAPVVRV